MGSPLAPVFANIIMTELESIIIKKLFDTGKINVDDTLLSIKPEDIQLAQNYLKVFTKIYVLQLIDSKMKCHTFQILKCQSKVSRFIVKISILDNMFIRIAFYSMELENQLDPQSCCKSQMYLQCKFTARREKRNKEICFLEWFSKVYFDFNN